MSEQMKMRNDDAAAKVLQLAKEYAKGIAGGAVTTGHLFYALVSSKTSLTSIFKSFGISANDVRKAVVVVDKQRQDVGPEEYASSEEYAGPARNAMERAAQVAKERQVEQVTPSDILLGLLPAQGAEVLDSDDFMAVLTSLTIDAEQLRQAVLSQLEKEGSATSGALAQGTVATPTLEKYARDLNAWGRDGKLAPCTWRGPAIAKIIEILGMRLQNNPVLVGETGVGTVSVVEGLVLNILNGEVPDSLKDVRIFQVDMGSITAGSKYRGEFEERLGKIVNEVKAAGNIILLIEDLHTIVGAGRIEDGGADATSFLKPLLARGELRCIGTTSPDEYRTHIERDTNLNGLFQQVPVAELSVEDTVVALKAVKGLYEAHHGVTYTDKALKTAAMLSKRYLYGTKLPGKSIQLIDQAGSRTKNARSANKVVDEADIIDIVVGETGLPLASLTKTETEKLLAMADTLHESIIGQVKAIDSIHAAFLRLHVGLRSPDRPIASFLFIGPTGVGKTEVARALAQYLFDSPDALVRLDMSEYTDASSVSKLIGTSAGFVGYKDPGQLTEPIRRRPYSVLLLDEFEKAHPSIWNLLLQVLDAGRLTDGAGRTVDFRNVVVIATSNVGSQAIRGNLVQIGIKVAPAQPAAPKGDRKSEVLEKELAKKFVPELLNRWDEIIEFQQLEESELEAIVGLLVQKRFADLLTTHNLQVRLDGKAAAYIVKLGDPAYGARPLGRAMQQLIETPLAIGILRGEFIDCDVLVVVENDELVLKKVDRI